MNDELIKEHQFGRMDSYCGYFKEIDTCENIITRFSWYKSYNPKDEEKGPEILKQEEDRAEKLYSALLERGFIRDGRRFYQPQCGECQKCTPIRMKAAWFKPSKSQRTVYRKNSDVEVIIVTDKEKFVTKEKVRMLADYYNHHNPDDVMPDEEAESALKSLSLSYSAAFQMEFRVNGKLMGVSELDITKDDKGNDYALVSKYFFYDLSEYTLKRSIGVFSVLKEIEYCKANGIKYYYLGLFIDDCRKMNYKINYKPYELLVRNAWVPLAAKADSTLIDFEHPYTFPPPGSNIYDEELCLITEEISNHLLYNAYRQGVFPWFCEDRGEPVLWQSPEDRYVIFPESMHVPKSIRKQMHKNEFTFTMDKCFRTVMENCRQQYRPGQSATWIGDKMLEAYTRFHEAGFAHSIEAWKDGELAGGFYGILMGSLFCGESMFTDISGSSKEAFVRFAKAFEKAGGIVIDCQMKTDNMARYQGTEMSREEYLELIKKAVDTPLRGKIQL